MEIDKNIFRLEHIIESIDKIEILVNTIKTFENFDEMWIERDAVIRNFEIIGEASNHVSEDVKNKYPVIPWNEMRGMRNFLSHEYFGLQLDTIWSAAINDIPVLKNQIQRIIRDLEKKK